MFSFPTSPLIIELTTERHSTIVSLLSLGGVLYAGTAGGIILVLSSAFTVLSTLHACLKLNRCLLGVKSAQRISIISEKFSTTMINRGAPIKRQKGMDTTQSIQSQSTAAYSFTLPANITNRNIIISFGQYFGISSKSPNRPPTLQLPTQPSSGTGNDEMFSSMLNKQSSHMLLWSAWNPSAQEAPTYAEK